MRLNSRLPISSDENHLNNSEWYQMGLSDSDLTSYVQDTVHIITKLRTKFLKSDSILPLGNYVATVAHLEILVKNYTKDQHMLTITDLKAEDKMNYAAAEKVCSPEVRKMIADNIDNSAGTTAYLKLMYLISAAFLDKTLSIVEKIYNIWY
ncbi:hypothetical protein Zmor_025234 [Zophobas morio]|uniref:Uncharacterized protein n=1 Tax=Zophobas morio TaxID=2755281 RepID=A0AA38HT30_9CUCU|nr:hypothetical protein Zmor_025234 [Zophobas morio]